MENQRPGRVILLNGASSSGKCSIGRALQPILVDPWFLFPVEALGAMRSTEHTRALESHEVDAMLRRTRLGYHRAVAALACAGNDVIMDYPLSEPWRLADLLDVLEAYDVTLVDVHCAADELDRRERIRGDRPVGLAMSQWRVLGHADHDITVDTTESGLLGQLSPRTNRGDVHSPLNRRQCLWGRSPQPTSDRESANHGRS